jgi:TonB family protein
MAASLGGHAFGSQEQAKQIAGYWTADARWQSKISSKTRSDYFWSGRMWGRIDETGRFRFDADNGCVALGVLAQASPNYSWSGSVNVTNCQMSDMDGRYAVVVSGGRPQLSLRFSSTRLIQGATQDTYEVAGTFGKYDPTGAVANYSDVKSRYAGGLPVQGGTGATMNYLARVKAIVLPNITRPVGTLPGGPVTVDVEISTAPDGRVKNVRLVRQSGSPAWDSAVMGAVARTGTLPRDADGRVPPTVIVSFSAKE